MSLPFWWPADIFEICSQKEEFYQKWSKPPYVGSTRCVGKMTLLEFDRKVTYDAARAVLGGYRSGFKCDFMGRVSTPDYVLREWEEQVIAQILTLSSSVVD